MHLETVIEALAKARGSRRLTGGAAPTPLQERRTSLRWTMKMWWSTSLSRSTCHRWCMRHRRGRPVEALPVDPLPVHAVTWLSRLLSFFGQHAYFLTFAGALIENTIFLGFLLPGGAVVALAGPAGAGPELSLPLLILLATAGMVGGAFIDYLLGRAGIARLLHHPLMGHWGIRMAHQLEQAEPPQSSRVVDRAPGARLRHGALRPGRRRRGQRAALRRFLVMEAPASSSGAPSTPVGGTSWPPSGAPSS